jgi:hypothetical protein
MIYRLAKFDAHISNDLLDATIKPKSKENFSQGQHILNLDSQNDFCEVNNGIDNNKIFLV